MREREIPTAEMVREYAREAGIEVDAEQFIRVNQANGWRDGRGMPIQSWRIWLTGYAARMQANPQARAVPTALNYPQREQTAEDEKAFWRHANERLMRYAVEEG